MPALVESTSLPGTQWCSHFLKAALKKSDVELLPPLLFYACSSVNGITINGVWLPSGKAKFRVTGFLSMLIKCLKYTLLLFGSI